MDPALAQGGSVYRVNGRRGPHHTYRFQNGLEKYKILLRFETFEHSVVLTKS